ncbi:MAG: DUF4384 domain-containing protein [Archangium sp.]|nr:DUF4384 domain-containing protein [Archangium sp.]
MNTPPRGASCPPQLHLEQASAGDWLPGVQSHVDGCAACKTQVESLQKMTSEFVAARPVERFLKQLETREAAPEKARRSFLPLAIGASLAALVVFTVVQSLPREPRVTMKGGLAHITMKRGEDITTITSKACGNSQPGDTCGEKLAPGDALRFSVVAPREGYAVVLNRDSTGAVTVVAPFGASEGKAVNAGTNVLPDSAVLDDVRGAETFVTIFSEHPIDVRKAVESFKATGSVSCDCTVEISTFDKP